MMPAEKTENTGGFYRSPSTAMTGIRPGTIIPIGVVTDENFEDSFEAETTLPPEKEKTGPVLHFEFLHFTKNLSMKNTIRPDGSLEKEISGHPLWLRLSIFLSFVLILFVIAFIIQYNRISALQEKQKQAQKKLAVALDKKEDELAEKLLTPIVQEEPQQAVKKIPLNSMRIYKSAEEIIPHIKQSEEKSLKILREGIRLQNEAAFADSPEEKKQALKQAIHRLRAVIMNSRVSDYNRRWATYKLWVIYACKMKNAKLGASSTLRLLKKYNHQVSSNKRFHPVCPVD